MGEFVGLQQPCHVNFSMADASLNGTNWLATFVNPQFTLHYVGDFDIRMFEMSKVSCYNLPDASRRLVKTISVVGS